MKTGQSRIYELKEVQLKIETRRAERVIEAISRQLSQHEKLRSANGRRFENIRSALLVEGKETNTEPRKLQETEALLMELRNIKGKNKLIERSLKVLVDRRQSEEKVFALAKERSALSKKEIDRIASKNEKLKEAQAMEYQAGMQIYLRNREFSDHPNRMGENMQWMELQKSESKVGQDVSLLDCSRGFEAPFQARLEQASFSNADINSSAFGPKSSSEAQTLLREMQCSENQNALNFQYTAKDGGAFHVELSAVGKNLRVFVFPSTEKDRKVLQGQRIKLQQELSEHGFVVREFKVRGNGNPGVRVPVD